MMPASFLVKEDGGNQTIIPDYGNRAIARVTPIDSCFWWIFLLKAYIKACRQGRVNNPNPQLYQNQMITPDVEDAIRSILRLSLSNRFDTEPMLLVPDGACMIDRRMGISGYPLEVQSLFYQALMDAETIVHPLQVEGISDAQNRRQSLKKKIVEKYWIDPKRLGQMYQAEGNRYGVEDENVTQAQQSERAENQETELHNDYNIFPDSIPYKWLSEWLSEDEDTGYFAGNIGPSQMDCRFFTVGNLMAIISDLAQPDQSRKIINLIRRRREDLIGSIPMKICYPALEGRDWELLTGCDPKNKPLKNEKWPEYYDGVNGRLPGREARKFQTWTIGGFLLAQELIDNPDNLELLLTVR